MYVMKIQKGVVSLLIVLTLIGAAGCSQNSDIVVQEEVSNHSGNTGTQTNGTIDKVGSTTILFKKDFSQATPNLAEFQEGVSFDLSDDVKDFFTRDVADKVSDNMNAVTRHDETKFKENMLDEETIKINMNWFTYKYEEGVKLQFTEVNEITYNEDAKRIQVVVTFLRNIKDEAIEQGTLTYSLLEDKDNGAWMIATMDGN